MRPLFIVVAIIIVVGVGVISWKKYKTEPEISLATISNFEECAEAGFPIMESYPPRCSTGDGRTFTQNIGNELEKTDLIRLETPRPNQTITSPLTIRGEARGNWFFEASFPARLLDEKGVELAIIPVMTSNDWMTTDFVPFEATMTFPTPTTKAGTLILQKDNPSGLPEHDDALFVPVYFGQ